MVNNIDRGMTSEYILYWIFLFSWSYKVSFFYIQIINMYRQYYLSSFGLFFFTQKHVHNHCQFSNKICSISLTSGKWCLKKYMRNFYFKAGNMKEMWNCHSCLYNKKKLNIIEINIFFLEPSQRNKFAEICRSRHIQRDTADSWVGKNKWQFWGMVADWMTT